MIKKFICMLGVGGCLFFSGCSNDVTTVEEDGVLPILFSATQTYASVNTETQTRATIADFPNNKSIAIIAAKSISETAPTDWANTNLFLNHEPATAQTGTEEEVGGTKVVTYPINLNTTQYWPFDADNNYLGFIAYSPATNSALTHSGTSLTVSANGSNKNFFDLLYTTPTSKAYNKVSGKEGVSLGEFKHAMSKLVIKIIPIDAITGAEVTAENILSELKITRLDIQTKATTGTIDLKSASPSWNLGGAEVSFQKVYTLVDNTTGKPAQSLPYVSTGDYFLLPAADLSLSQIGFKIKDRSFETADADYLINQFIATPGNTSVKLEMGKITTLTIKVKVATVQTGEDPDTTLEGTLTDWVYQGNSDVTIE